MAGWSSLFLGNVFAIAEDMKNKESGTISCDSCRSVGCREDILDALEVFSSQVDREALIVQGVASV